MRRSLCLLALAQPLLLSQSLTAGLAASATVVEQNQALAQDASEVARIAKAITVRIEGSTQGSGVLVKRDGNRYTVLTAWHVVSGNRPEEELEITTPDGKNHQLEQGSIQRLGEVDMAVLTFSSTRAYEVAAIGDVKNVKFDEPIYVAGFPISNSQMLKFETGEVVANAEVGIDQGYQLLYDNETAAGMSGGVLINANGKLIGLHGRGERNEQSSSGREIEIKTGINQGVPITYYSQFNSGSPIVVKTTLTTADDYLAQARASKYKEGRSQTVIRLAKQSLITRKSSAAYELIGEMKINMGNSIDAINDFNKAIQIQSHNPNPYINRGRAKRRIKDYDGAIDDFRTALKHSKSKGARGAAYNNLGTVKNDMRDYKGAISAYSKAIEQNSILNFMSYINRALSYQRISDLKAAQKDLSAAIQIYPDGGYAYIQRGNIKDDMGKLEEALVDYSKAIELEPNNPKAYEERGIAIYRTKNYKRALLDFSKAIDLGSKKSRIYVFRGRSQYELGDSRNALMDYNRAIQLNASNSNAYSERGVLKMSRKKFQDAIANFNTALEIDPKNAHAYFNRGLSKISLNQIRGGCKDFYKASLMQKTLYSKKLDDVCQLYKSDRALEDIYDAFGFE